MPPKRRNPPRFLHRILKIVRDLKEARGSTTKSIIAKLKSDSKGFSNSKKIAALVRQTLRHAVNDGMLKQHANKYRLPLHRRKRTGKKLQRARFRKHAVRTYKNVRARNRKSRRVSRSTRYRRKTTPSESSTSENVSNTTRDSTTPSSKSSTSRTSHSRSDQSSNSSKTTVNDKRKRKAGTVTKNSKSTKSNSAPKKKPQNVKPEQQPNTEEPPENNNQELNNLPEISKPSTSGLQRRHHRKPPSKKLIGLSKMPLMENFSTRGSTRRSVQKNLSIFEHENNSSTKIDAPCDDARAHSQDTHPFCGNINCICNIKQEHDEEINTEIGSKSHMQDYIN